MGGSRQQCSSCLPKWGRLVGSGESAQPAAIYLPLPPAPFPQAFLLKCQQKCLFVVPGRSCRSARTSRPKKECWDSKFIWGIYLSKEHATMNLKRQQPTIVRTLRTMPCGRTGGWRIESGTGRAHTNGQLPSSRTAAADAPCRSKSSRSCSTAAPAAEPCVRCGATRHPGWNPINDPQCPHLHATHH